jgi:hypothetical protein
MSFLGGSSDSGDNGDSNGGSPTQKSKAKKKGTFNIGGGPIAFQIVKAVGKQLAEAARPYNTKRRKEFISKYNTSVPPSERIDMSDKQIGSREGLATLRETGYTTAADVGVANKDRPTNNQIAKPILGSDIQKTAVKKAPDGPTIAEIAQEDTEEQRLAKIKRKGRKSTKLSKEDDELTLSKKTLLG